MITNIELNDVFAPQNINSGRNDNILIEPEFKRIKNTKRGHLTSSAVKMRSALTKENNESTLYTTINSIGKKPVTPSIAEYPTKYLKYPSMKFRFNLWLAFTRENRINKIFKLKTPGLKDCDIHQTLIDAKSTQREYSQSKSKSKQIRKEIFDLCRKWEKNSKKSK